MEMDWTQVYAIVGANIALMFVMFGTTITLFLWARKEASEDRRQIQEQANKDRKSAEELIKEIQNEMKDFHSAMNSMHTDFVAHMKFYHERKL
jgi:type VI protein secretion system component VasK